MMPPKTKFIIKAQANNIALFKAIFPPHRVANQLKNLMPVGTAMKAVAIVKNSRIHGGVPLVNIWWAQTIRPRKTMAIIE